MTHIQGNDGRLITLGYNGSSELIASVTANGRPWTYIYSTSTWSNPSWIPSNGASRTTLDSVTRPDQRQWIFDLDAMEAQAGSGINCLQQTQMLGVTHPTGVRGDFELREAAHRQSYSALTSIPWGCPGGEPPGGGTPPDPEDVTYFESMAVREKVLSGPGIPSYTWSFAYEGDWNGAPGPINTLCHGNVAEPETQCTNWTEVTEPDGRHITYYHLWNGEQLGGKLLRQEVRQDTAAGTLLERVDTEYLIEGAVGFTFARFGPSPATLGAPARMTERQTVRGSDTFTITNSYNTNQSHTNYSWGRPTKTVKTTSLKPTVQRETDTTYLHRNSADVWVLGLLHTVDRNGTRFDRFEYTPNGQLQYHYRFGNPSEFREYGYHTAANQRGRLAWVENAYDARTTLDNYHRGLPQLLTRPDLETLSRTVDDNGWIENSTDANGHTTTFDYNPIGWLKQVVPPTGVGTTANTDISYVFNSTGVEQTITKANLEVTVQYDGMLRAVNETRLDTARTSSVSHTRTQYDSQGRTTFRSFPSAIPAAPNGVLTEYDALGRPTRSEQNVAPFAVTTTEYLSDYRVRVTDPRGNSTTTHWLAFGAPAPTGPAGQSGDVPAWERDLPIRIDTPLGADRVMDYDDVGNIVSTQFGPALTQYYYNGENQLEKVTDPAGIDSFTYYDEEFRPLVTVDGEQRSTRTVYDVLGRPTKEIRAWAGLTNGLGATLDCGQMRIDTSLNPQSLQQCYSEIRYTPTGQIEWIQDAGGNRTRYEYDQLDRRTYTYYPPDAKGTETASLTDYTHVVHDALDYPETKRTRKGQLINYNHDALGRLIDRRVPDAPTHVYEGRTVTHHYVPNAWGHIEEATHDGETLIYGYDDIGRVTSQSYAGSRTVSYVWDPANNLERLTWPDGYAIDYFWDANNRIEFAKEGSRVLATVLYDSQSRRDAVLYDNNTSVDYGFSPRGDLDYHDHSFVGSSLDYDYTYNNVGQVATKTLSDPSYAWVTPTTGLDSYDVNGLNQYTDIGGVTVVHDDNGNLTSDHLGRTFTYDAENVLRTAAGIVGGTATYRYYADGTRRSKSHNGSTTQFYYMGGLGYLDAGDTAFAADQEIAEYSGSGALLRRFIRLPGSIDETFLMIDFSTGSPVETWAHTNRQVSTFATTNSAGTVSATYRYSPYGRTGVEGDGGFPFRYTGQRLDPETGLYYYKARYYDPEVGRFLQTDPIGYGDQMNLYAYVGNDVVNLVDPKGEACTVFNGWSQYCRRAAVYGVLDHKFGTHTRFFAAATGTVEFLANLEPPTGWILSKESRDFLSELSGALYNTNREIAKRLESGELTGLGLDSRIVHLEQSKVQEAIDSLSREEYDRIIPEINDLMNPSGFSDAAARQNPSDRAYMRIVDDVRKELGRDIDFSKQGDREAIGNAVIDYVRKSGGCDITGTRLKGC